jgi:hypothetical protein
MPAIASVSRACPHLGTLRSPSTLTHCYPTHNSKGAPPDPTGLLLHRRALLLLSLLLLPSLPAIPEQLLDQVKAGVFLPEL